MAEYSVIPLAETKGVDRWDSEFFSQAARGMITRLKEVGAQPLTWFIANAQRGSAPEYDAAGTVPVVRTVNVREFEFSNARQEYVSCQFFESAPKGKISHRDISVTSTGVGTLGRAFCNLSTKEYFADGHITVLTPKPQADPAYLTAVLQSSVGQIQFKQWQRGSSGQIEIYPEDILRFLIPKLPQQLQLKISTLWTSAVQLVQNAKNFYPDAERELLERLGWEILQRIKPELFFVEDISTLTMEERIDAEHFQPKYMRLRKRLFTNGSLPLGALCASIDKGTQPPEYIEDGPVVVVKSKNVFGQGIDFDNAERTIDDVFNDIPARLAAGDVVMNSTGFGTLGRAGFIPSNHPRKIVAAVDLLKLRVKPDQVLPEYLTLFLNSPAGLAQSEMLQTGSSGQLHLYPQHIRKILVFLPRDKKGNIDMAWQQKLAEKVIGASIAKKEAQIKLAKAKRIIEEILGMPQPKLIAQHQGAAPDSFPLPSKAAGETGHFTPKQVRN